MQLSETFRHFLRTMNTADMIVSFIVLLLIIGFIIKNKDKILEILEEWRHRKNFQENVLNYIEEMKEDTKRLKQDMVQFEQNRSNDREVSRAIRDELYKHIDGIARNVEDIKGDIKSMQEKEQASKRADIKKSIEKLYRECSDAKCCTDMQLETLKDLIEDYEANGGENSFVHSVVQKEMYTWHVIEKIPKS